VGAGLAVDDADGAADAAGVRGAADGDALASGLLAGVAESLGWAVGAGETLGASVEVGELGASVEVGEGVGSGTPGPARKYAACEPKTPSTITPPTMPTMMLSRRRRAARCWWTWTRAS
jgi:hypothetical protein